MIDPEKTNDYFVKLTGKGNIPEPLEIGRNYKLTASGTVTSLTESDKNDGSHNLYYKFEPVTIELVDDLGEAIKAKDTRSSSQLLRAKFWKAWQNQGTDMNFEDWYNSLMMNLLRVSDDLVDMYKPITE